MSVGVITLASNLRYFGIVPTAALKLRLTIAKFQKKKKKKDENMHTGPNPFPW